MNAVNETHECVNSSTGQSKKRLSALAQLIRRLRTDGIITIAELMAETGYSRRAVCAAKTELREVQPSAPAGAAECTQAIPSPLKEKSPPAPPLKKIHPSPNSIEVGVCGEVSADAAEKSKASAGKEYVFEGEVVRLNRRDFDRWRQAFPAIPDLTVELQVADDYYRDSPPDDGKWFPRVSRWLAKANAEAKAGKHEIYKCGMTRKEYEEIYPPEIYGGLLQ